MNVTYQLQISDRRTSGVGSDPRAVQRYRGRLQCSRYWRRLVLSVPLFLLFSGSLASAQDDSYRTTVRLDTSETFRDAFASGDDSLRVYELMTASFDLPRTVRDSAMLVVLEAAELGEKSTGTGLHLDVASAWHWVGRHALSQAKLDIAEKAFKRELAILDVLVGEDHPYRANSIDHIGRTIRKSGDLKGALPYYRESLRLRRRYFGDQDHPDLAGSLNNLALLESNLGHFQTADSLYRVSLEMKRRMYDTINDDLATTINNLGSARLKLGYVHESLQLFREGVGMLRQTAEGKPVLAAGIAGLARAFYAYGNFDSSALLVREALAIRSRVYRGDHTALATADAALGRALWRLGERNEGEEKLRESIAMLNRLFPEGHHVTASVMVELAQLLWEDGETPEAIALLQDAQAMQGHLLEPDHPQITESTLVYARILTGEGRLDEAAELLMAISGNIERWQNPDHPVRGLYALAVGELRQKQGNRSSARDQFSVARRILAVNHTPGHPYLSQAEQHIARLGR